MSTYRPTFLSLMVLLSALAVPSVAFGQQTAEEFFKQGKVKQDKGDLNGAIVEYTKAIELNSKDDAAYYHRGESKDAVSCVGPRDAGDQ